MIFDYSGRVQDKKRIGAAIIVSGLQATRHGQALYLTYKSHGSIMYTKLDLKDLSVQNECTVFTQDNTHLSSGIFCDNDDIYIFVNRIKNEGKALFDSTFDHKWFVFNNDSCVPYKENMLIKATIIDERRYFEAACWTEAHMVKYQKGYVVMYSKSFDKIFQSDQIEAAILSPNGEITARYVIAPEGRGFFTLSDYNDFCIDSNGETVLFVWQSEFTSLPFSGKKRYSEYMLKDGFMYKKENNDEKK